MAESMSLSLGGFECEFVEKPTEAFQTNCLICLLVLREPYQVVCCGKSFCRSCIERVKASKKPCPHCNKNDFEEFHNKGLQQSLYQLKVQCTHQKEGCEWTGELGTLDEHITESCPHELVNCTFNFAGCERKILRKDMDKHLTDIDNIVIHMKMLADSHQKQGDQIDELKQENEALKCKITQLKGEMKSDRAIVKALQERNNFPPVDIIMPDFEQHKTNTTAWYSPPFYTHQRGYKLCLRCYANSIYVKDYVSVYVYMMQGEFDDELKWPLRCQVTIQLLNHNPPKKHHTKTITVDDPKSYSRLRTTDRSIGGKGDLGFISHDDLYQGYVKDDSLCFRIFKVALK